MIQSATKGDPIPDILVVPCGNCQSEGRILRECSRHWGLEPKEIDCGECPVCEGTGFELAETEAATEEEIMEGRL